MLPFEFVAGRDYRSRNGGLATCLLNASDRTPKVEYPIVFHHHGLNEYQSHTVAGHLMKGSSGDFDIIMPADTWGVYHVSDGDTPLKAALERWVCAGGAVQAREMEFDDGWTDGCDGYSLTSAKILYRAVGCTAEPVIDPPQPPAPQPDWRSKPVTHGDMVDYLHFTTADIRPRHEEILMWWRERAQQDSRP